jgi:hypothetical protein
VKGIQVCSNKGPGSLQRGDNHKNVRFKSCILKNYEAIETEFYMKEF